MTNNIVTETNPIPKFMQVQAAFAAHLRDPEKHPKPADVEDRRMNIYRELFYNNMQNFIANGFPVMRKLFSDEQWHRMVRRFFHDHQSHTPYFPEIAGEFVQWLQNEREAAADDPGFLIELAQHEWAEVIVALDDSEIDLDNINAEGDLLAEKPQLNPWLRLFQYQYPVHQIGPDFQPQTPSEQPILLLVYRRLDDSVQFMELNPVTARLIQLLQEQQGIEQTGGITGEELLAAIAKELGHADASAIRQAGLETLNNLRERGVILGTC